MSRHFSNRAIARILSLCSRSPRRRSTRIGKVFLWSVCAVFLFAVILGVSSAPLAGQAVNATVLGTVADSTGAAVANAKVTITETNTNISRSTQTNDSGNYVFPDLPPGTYRVTAEQTGFKRASRAGIDVVVNTTSRIDLDL